MARVNEKNEKLKFYLGFAFNGILDESKWGQAVDSGELIQKKL